MSTCIDNRRSREIMQYFNDCCVNCHMERINIQVTSQKLTMKPKVNYTELASVHMFYFGSGNTTKGVSHLNFFSLVPDQNKLLSSPRLNENE